MLPCRHQAGMPAHSPYRARTDGSRYRRGGMQSSAKLLIFSVKPCTPRPLPAAAARFARLPDRSLNGPKAFHTNYMDARGSETVIRITLLRYLFKSREVNHFLARKRGRPVIFPAANA